MNALKIQSLLLLIISILACKEKEQLPTLSSGRIERFAPFQSKIINARTVDVWVPDTYDQGEAHAVLYMHDGQMLFDSSLTWNGQEWGVDEHVAMLIANQQIRPTIVVAIWNDGANRHSDYFPQQAFALLPTQYADSIVQNTKRGDQLLFTQAPNSDNYLRFIVEELKPFIDQHYRVKTDPANTFIMGSSMGGLISLYALTQYPHVFGGAGCLSTHWIGVFDTTEHLMSDAFYTYMEKYISKTKGSKWYFDRGNQTLDQYYATTQARIDSLFYANNWDSVYFKSLVFEEAAHDEKSWNERLAIPLRFLLAQ
jgi:enterochelin esterase-like enzyme